MGDGSDGTLIHSLMGLRTPMEHNRDRTDKARDLGSAMADTMAKMTELSFRWPMAVTGAAMDAVVDGMRVVSDSLDRTARRTEAATGQRETQMSSTSSTRSTASRTSASSPAEDLSGDDLKYVVWAIVFTKPHYETVLEPQRDEIVNYDTDAGTFAGLKIGAFLDRARQGKIERPQTWNERGYASHSTSSSRRSESGRSTSASTTTTASSTSTGGSSESREREGWRIPPEDHKYIKFLYRVDRRLAKEEVEVTRVEKVTVEHTTAGSATT